ncbi:MAG: hypothetical protein H6744_09805 [Deltaproteobacteria bacterium]|nr:hypothetical protein [Deltaproteobacteria bacterium]MCB9786972.1 hypothetical protein [Deltaproteobacteria bacterium]
MRARRAFLVIVSLVITCLVARASEARVLLGAAALEFPEPTALTEPSLSDEASWVARRGCRLVPLDADERARVGEAAALAARVVSSPAFARSVSGRQDWVLRRAARWVRSAEAGREALRLLTASERRIAVLAVDDGAEGTCETLLEHAALHAYTPEGADVVVVQRSYLRDRAIEAVAATLLHEVMHVLGFAHPVGALDLDQPAYRRSVPVLLAELMLSSLAESDAKSPPVATMGRDGGL